MPPISKFNSILDDAQLEKKYTQFFQRVRCDKNKGLRVEAFIVALGNSGRDNLTIDAPIPPIRRSERPSAMECIHAGTTPKHNITQPIQTDSSRLIGRYIVSFTSCFASFGPLGPKSSRMKNGLASTALDVHQGFSAQWMQAASNRSNWRSMGEVYVQWRTP